MDRDAPGVPVNVYRVEGANSGQELTLDLQYEGAINFSVRQSVANMRAPSASRRA